MNKFKDYVIILLVAILGGYLGTVGGQYTNKSEPTIDHTITESIVTHEKSSLKEGIDEALESVVEITVKSTANDYFYGEMTATSLGSGVICTSDGYIITNDHVVNGADEVFVETIDGKNYEAKVIGSDSKTDLAVIKIEANDLKAATIADSETIEVGDTAIVIGNPLGIGISVSDGIISALNIPVTINNETMYLIQTNAAVNQGNSGGGLFNIKGELIGIVNAKKSASAFDVTVEGLGYAIPSNRVKTIASDIMENGYVKNRPTLGIAVSYVSANMGGFEKGLYITKVYEQSAAEKAGLKMYDRIIGYNDIEINDYTALSQALSESKIGDQIDLKIIREDKELSIPVILQEASNIDE